MARSNLFLMAAVSAGAVLCSFAGPSISAEAAKPAADKPAAVKTVPIKYAPSDFPVGIRTGIARLPIAKGAGVSDDRGGGGRQKEVQGVIFADTAGRPLYFSTTDIGCTGDCLKKWQPALAVAGSKGTGDWTLASFGGDKQQWYFRGKPLYVHNGDLPIDAPSKISEGDPTRPPAAGVAVQADGQDGMAVIRVEPQNWTKMPFNMGVAEYRLAPGQVMAVGVAGNNPMGHPLYLYSGTAEQEKTLPAKFRPQYAAALDLPLGDFTIRERSVDSTRQWVYKGSPLYTCDCDISTGDLNGRGTPGITVATLLHYNVPSQVFIKKDSLAIGYIVEASSGKTLYYRDRLKDDYTPDHVRPMGGTEDPGIGSLLNLKHCDATCEKEWKPFLAPKNVQPQGYWSTYLRPDGTRQWAYKNAALYTHVPEKPGTLDGNESYNINIVDYGVKEVPAEFGLGMMWRALVP